MSQAVTIQTVKFMDGSDNYEYKSGCEKSGEKKRNLTMKYGQEQRRIVHRRLKVESWMDGELCKLYNITDPNQTYPCDPDLDEIMELETEKERRSSIMEFLKSCKQTDEIIQAFADELLEKMKTL